MNESQIREMKRLGRTKFILQYSCLALIGALMAMISFRILGLTGNLSLNMIIYICIGVFIFSIPGGAYLWKLQIKNRTAGQELKAPDGLL